MNLVQSYEEEDCYFKICEYHCPWNRVSRVKRGYNDFIEKNALILQKSYPLLLDFKQMIYKYILIIKKNASLFENASFKIFNFLAPRSGVLV